MPLLRRHCFFSFSDIYYYFDCHFHAFFAARFRRCLICQSRYAAITPLRLRFSMADYSPICTLFSLPFAATPLLRRCADAMTLARVAPLPPCLMPQPRYISPPTQCRAMLRASMPTLTLLIMRFAPFAAFVFAARARRRDAAARRCRWRLICRCCCCFFDIYAAAAAEPR